MRQLWKCSPTNDNIPDSRDGNRFLTASCRHAATLPLWLWVLTELHKSILDLSHESLWWFQFSLLFTPFMAVFFLLTHQSRVTVFVVVMLSNAFMSWTCPQSVWLDPNKEVALKHMLEGMKAAILLCYVQQRVWCFQTILIGLNPFHLFSLSSASPTFFTLFSFCPCDIFPLIGQLLCFLFC